MSTQIIYGSSIHNNDLPGVLNNAVVSYPGMGIKTKHGFQVDEDILSKHILLLGGSGCGKTNVFFYTLSDLRKSMTSDDVAIVFDTKGEFYESFCRSGDVVVGNSARFRDISYTWNIFDEILADGWDPLQVSMNVKEISAALFHGRGSTTQPFFCNAARDIFGGILLHFIRQAEADPDLWMKRLNNKDLLYAFRGFKVEHYLRIFEHYSDTRYMLSYFGDGKSNQALGVFGELNSMLSEYFIGILAEYDPEKRLSMRQAVRRKGGKMIFIEYDLSVGEVLSPVYRLLVDQALKEALSRNGGVKNGSVYVIADEFKLLPMLQHIDDALNFGRGMGVKVMAGIQSIDQLYEIYGEEKGAVIAGGFGSMFAFHTNDGASRDYIRKRFGSNMVVYDYLDQKKNSVIEREREGYTVEEWDQMELGLGQAVIGLGYGAPFLFQFAKYENGG